MSESDSFIQEVTDEVRRDRMFRLWRRYGPLAIGAVVLAVAATAAFAWLDHRRAVAAQEAGGRLLRAAEPTDPARRAEGFLALTDSEAAGPALLARLRAAAELAATGETQAAVAQYRAVAEDAAAPLPFAQFAALRAATLDAPRAGSDATIAALTPLTAPDGAFRLLALEARAAARLAQGDRDGAAADLRAVLLDPLATENTRLRAAETLAVLGEDAP